ncbi:MAG: hypothetical protein Q9222_004363 [Ikaeria aurantiellina]
MSAPLWKAFFDHNVEQFRQFLANAIVTSATSHAKAATAGSAAGSPGTTLGTSPTLTWKGKRIAGGHNDGFPTSRGSILSAAIVLSRTDLNCRESSGCTLLHHIASSSYDDAVDFATALLDIPILDLYIQDTENGWTALHRALYFGNVAIARLLIERDLHDSVGEGSIGGRYHSTGLIKIKDHEKNSPFDVYGASIASRNIRHDLELSLPPDYSDEEDGRNSYGVDDGNSDEDSQTRTLLPRINTRGDELFTFGSNKNFTLGFGDEDDRQFPERIFLKRPDRLLRRLAEQCRTSIISSAQTSPGPVPAVIQYRPIIIQDIRLAKLHSAVLTDDPEANLYVCGFGPGGRLGLGDEVTRFHYLPVCTGGLGSRKIIDIGLGQNHTIAVTSRGEVFSWGSNAFGQLGYALPTSNSTNEGQMQLLPKQIFGPLKREDAQGTAASRIHTIVYTSTSLYTFGKNDGQLGLVDSDARSLAAQTTPRRVAASLFPSPISTVSAIDKASICLLENHDVWIFANYGYAKISFPLDSSRDLIMNHFLATRYSSAPNHICKITSGGDTVCAMSNEGDVFSVNISQKLDSTASNGSTTNPSKIRGALSAPQKIWTRKKGHMAVRDVDVGQDGSIIICTDAGSVWRRVKRAKVKDANAPFSTDYKPKDYKFSRIPGLTRIVAVRSNTSGAYAAVRRDCDVLRAQVNVHNPTLWRDLHPLLPFKDFAEDEDSETENPRPRFWTASIPASDTSSIIQAVFRSSNIEQSIAQLFAEKHGPGLLDGDMNVGTTTSELHIPIHEFILGARCPILSRALSALRTEYFYSIPRVLSIEYGKDGKILLLFHDVDFLTVFNFVLYIYTDAVAEVWLQTRQPAPVISRYRQVRTELLQITAILEMRQLEQAVRAQVQPPKTLHEDMDRIISEPTYFDNGDVLIELNGGVSKAHSSILCQRCPFFEGLFQGRAAGRWLSSRRQQSQETIAVDLKHVDPKVFDYLRRHIYADVAEELFDLVCCPDSDSFLDLVLEVMSVANELMLDRLAQCCQTVVGRYVDSRNVCQLLNAIAPCSVTAFKTAALEYICLNLEGILENHLMNDLDEDLLLELDNTVRQNQLARLPIARSHRADMELQETYPQLAEIIERGKRIKIDRIAFQSRWRHDGLLNKVFRGRGGTSYDEDGPNETLNLRDQTRKAFRRRSPQRISPTLKAKGSTVDLMFQMDVNDESPNQKPHQPTLEAPSDDRTDSSPLLPPSLGTESGAWADAQRNDAQTDCSFSTSPFDLGEAALQPQIGKTLQPSVSEVTNAPKPWGERTFSSEKLDMKALMAQASSQRTSSMSSNYLSPTPKASAISKLSQKDRRKQQQQERSLPVQAQATVQVPVVESAGEIAAPSSPWQVASSGTKTSLKDILGAESKANLPDRGYPDRVVSNPPLTMRQTMPGNVPLSKRTTSEGSSKTAPLAAHRSVSTPTPAQQPNTPPRPSSSRGNPSPAVIGPSNNTPIKSIRHNSTPQQQLTAEPSLQLSMADILSQQQTEKDVIKEAAAKRSLQEIQEEQAFQEWWDQESRKVMEEEEAAAKAATTTTSGRREGRGRVRGRGRGRVESKGSGRGKERGDRGEGDAAGAEKSRGGRGIATSGSVSRGTRGRGRGNGA